MGYTTAMNPKMENSLDDSCEEFVGKTLHVTPVYGWGWSGNPEQPDAPKDFEMRLLRLWSDEKGRRGGVGEVEDPNHPCHGWAVVFSTRHVGLFNFTDKLGHYNITITAGDIIVKKGWPSPDGDHNSYIGFATVEAMH